MSLPHEAALHFLILIVMARLVNGAAAPRDLTGASSAVAYAGGPSRWGANGKNCRRYQPGTGRSGALVGPRLVSEGPLISDSERGRKD